MAPAASRVLPLLILAVAAAAAETGARTPRPADEAMVVAQVPAGALPAAPFAGGTLRAPIGDGGRLILVRDGRSRVLTAGFHSAADPEVSFDGRAVLFAGRKTDRDPWCIWEMQADGSGARKITCGAAGARQPIYQPTLFTITPTNIEPWVQVAFVGDVPGQRNEAGLAPLSNLWSCKLDGSALRRLTFNLSNDLDPVVLPDGRMIYAGWLRHGGTGGPNGRMALLGVNLDGTDYQGYSGARGLRVKQMPAPTSDGLVVFVESDEVAADGAGRLAVVAQSRPLHTYRSLTVEGDGLFRSPSPLPEGKLLVSWRPADGRATASILRYDPATGRRETVLADPAWHSVQAKRLAPRPMPDARSSVVREDDATGKLFALDVNIHDLGAKLPRGEAKALRIVEGVAATAAGPARRRLLGTIPLAADGSFQVQVPANTPIQLQLLDRDGLALRNSAWIWVRNHAAQGCVGCHEDPERTPPNRFVDALRAKSPVLDQPPDQRRTVSWAADLKPIAENRCRSCHGVPGGAVPLDTTAAGLGRLASPGEARRSRLMWHLLGRNMARPWDAEASSAAPRPLPEEARPTPDQIRAFIEWIDLGGQP